MSERLETLNKARARMLEDRDVHTKVLAAPFDRDKVERALRLAGHQSFDVINRNTAPEIMSIERQLIDLAPSQTAIGGEGGVAPKG